MPPKTKKRYALRWAATSAGWPENIGILLLRVIVAVVFIVHGVEKWLIVGPTETLAMFAKMGIPTWAGYCAMAAELGCGSLLALGLVTRLAAIPLVITMGVAVYKVHLQNGFSLQHGGYEYALTLGVACLALFFTGSGWLGLDNVIAQTD